MLQKILLVKGTVLWGKGFFSTSDADLHNLDAALIPSPRKQKDMDPVPIDNSLVFL
jgi:hypothetical protein